MSDSCPLCSAKLNTCQGCGKRIGRRGPRRSEYCGPPCRRLAMKARYNRLISLGYTQRDALKGRSSGHFERLLKRGPPCSNNETVSAPKPSPM